MPLKRRYLPAVIAVAFLSLPCDAEPPAKSEDEAVAKVRTTAATAEVHCVAVYEPAVARFEQVSNWPEFVAAVRTKEGPAGRVWELFSKETQKRVSDDKIVATLVQEKGGDAASPSRAALKGSVSADLRTMIDNPDFYTKEAFKNVPLTKEMKAAIALGRKRTTSQTARLNWSLLDAAFPGCIPPLPARFRTVRVRVVAGADVVLVLSSCTTCRWEVELLQGANVTGVVLCGNGAQEVAGVDAPTVYRAYYAPDGVSLARPYDYFYAPVKGKGERFNKEEEEQDKQFAEKVQEITGKKPSSLQRDYYPAPNSEPYIVRPGTKK